MILIVDACIDRENSRTERLLKKWIEVNVKPEDDVVYRILEEEDLVFLDKEERDKRLGMLVTGDFSQAKLDDARQFAEADLIVIAAPYWNISFPAALHAYLEQVSVAGVAYRYSETGELQGLCKAKKIVYITTVGGPMDEVNHGYGFIQSLAGLFGIGETQLFVAQMLDVFRDKVDAILQETEKQIAEG